MRILIVEDEPAAQKRMLKLLAEAAPDAEVVACLPSVAAAVEWFRGNPQPDLAFFDVRLADGDSFSIFERASVECPVIFVTAYDAYALKAFQVHAVDYLLKPLKAAELASALQRVNRSATVRQLAPLAAPVQEDHAPAPALIKRFLIRYGDHFRVVEPKDIAYIFSLEKNTFLRTREGRDLPLDDSLDRL